MLSSIVTGLNGSLSPQEYPKVASWGLYCSPFTSMTYPLFLPFLSHSYLPMTPSAVQKYSLLTIVLIFKMTYIDAIHTWSLSSSLTFNTSKCCLLRFSNRYVKQISSTYFFNGDKIPSLNQCRDLGVIFSSNLSWSPHHDMILAKAYKQLGSADFLLFYIIYVNKS